MWKCKKCGGEFIMIIEEKNRIGILGIPSKTLSKEAIELYQGMEENFYVISKNSNKNFEEIKQKLMEL